MLPADGAGFVSLLREPTCLVGVGHPLRRDDGVGPWVVGAVRAALAGTRDTYALFRDWIAAKDGDAIDTRITASFDDLATLYGGIDGDALPPVPSTWSSAQPSAADLATPFGQLWQQVHATSGTVVNDMNEIAKLLGFPQFVEQ